MSEPLIRRLFLSLLVFALALPAVALPSHAVQAQPAMAMAHHGAGPTPAPTRHDHGATKPDHSCIGCIAAYGAAPEPPDARLPHAAALAVRQPQRLSATPSAPDTPPPRS